jgi:hypothetical protein
MTPEALAESVRAAGYFAQVRPFGTTVGVEAAHLNRESDDPVAPLVRALRLRDGRWALTVFGETAVGVLDPAVLPAVVIDLLREMDRCLDLPSAVIERYGLIPLDPAELATGDT